MNITSSWQLANAAAFGINTAVTYGVGTGLARLSSLGLQTNKEVSQAHPTIVTPKGWAFSIWGPIFIGEAAFTAWSFYLSDDGTKRAIQALSPHWQLVCLGQAFWTVSFARSNMIVSAASLPFITAQLVKVYHGINQLGLTGREYWYVHLPIALHASWACCASLVQLNITSSVYIPSLDTLLARLSIVAAAAGNVALSWYSSDPIPSFVGAWALWAIGANSIEAPTHAASNPKGWLASAEVAKNWARIGAVLLVGLGVADLAARAMS